MHKGFKLILESLLIILECDFKIKSLSADVYTALSKRYGISCASIQKDIKNAIDFASLNGDIDFFNNEFQSVISAQGSVSAAAFIFFVADKMRIYNNKPSQDMHILQSQKGLAHSNDGIYYQ